MPVQLNEPLNTLQRLCEELEYSELLDKAAHTQDPFERMVGRGHMHNCINLFAYEKYLDFKETCSLITRDNKSSQYDIKIDLFTFLMHIFHLIVHESSLHII